MKRIFLLLTLSLTIIQFSNAQLHGTAPEWGSGVELPKLNAASSARGSVGFTNCIGKDGLFTNFYTNQFPYPNGLSTLRYSQSSDNFNTFTDQVFQPAQKTIGSCCVNVATDTADNLHVIWKAQQPLGVFYSRFDKQLNTWGDTVRISDWVNFNPHDPTLTVDRRMQIHAMWHDGNPDAGEIAEVMYVQSPDNGLNWNSQVMVSDNDGRSSAFPRANLVAVTGDTLALTWRDNPSGSQWDVMLGLSTNNSVSWITSTIAGGAGTQSDPGIIIDNHGNFHVNYHEYPAGNPFDGAQVMAGSSTDLGATWNPSGFIQVSDTFRSHLTVYLYDIVNDVIWIFYKDERDFVGGNPRADILACYSEDGGLTYSKPEYITDGDTLSEGLKSACIGMDGKPILNYEFMTGMGGRWTQYFKKRIPVQEELLPKSFFTLHCDPPFDWPALERIVEVGNENGVYFTIEIHPLWADSILTDTSRWNQLRIWEAEGHEVGFHHHGLNHAGARDGFTNENPALYIPDANDAPYRGDMGDYWNLMIQLAGDSGMVTGGIGDYDTDWPVQLGFQTRGGRNPWNLSSVVTDDTLNGKRVCRIDYTFIEDTTYVNTLINDWYPKTNSDSVVGVVTHPSNVTDDSLFFNKWIGFIGGKNCMIARDIILMSDCPEEECVATEHLFTDKITPISAKLNWDLVSAATQFEIRGRNMLNPNWTYLAPLSAGDSSKQVYGLSNNTAYTWQVRTICGADSAQWSDADTFTTGCQTPDSNWTNPVNASGARLNWTKVTGAIGYRIAGQRIGSATWVSLQVAGGNTLSKDVFGLSASTAYRWAVRALCDTATGIVSDPSALDTFTTAGSARLASNPSESDGMTEQGVYIYPNPVSESATIEIVGLSEVQTTSLTIFDLRGKPILFSSRVSDKKVKIDCSEMPAGIYFLEVGNAVMNVRKKFVVQ